jgi:hypothetical protein
MPVEKVSKFANLMSMVGANTDRGIWKFWEIARWDCWLSHNREGIDKRL